MHFARCAWHVLRKYLGSLNYGLTINVEDFGHLPFDIFQRAQQLFRTLYGLFRISCEVTNGEGATCGLRALRRTERNVRLLQECCSLVRTHSLDGHSDGSHATDPMGLGSQRYVLGSCATLRSHRGDSTLGSTQGQPRVGLQELPRLINGCVGSLKSVPKILMEQG